MDDVSCAVQQDVPIVSAIMIGIVNILLYTENFSESKEILSDLQLKNYQI